MPKNIPLNKALYAKVKKMADEKYDKPSAYKSGWMVKKYKELGGTYSGVKTKEGLTAWYNEKWTDVGHEPYPVYRPTERVNAKTPLTLFEIDPTQLKKQIKLKQKIKGEHNLPPFERR
jgi:hypothetical protein